MTKNQAIIPIARGSIETLVPVVEQARTYAKKAIADNTNTAYKSDWKDFEAWCDLYGLQALPVLPEALAAYITTQAERLATSTIRRRLASISREHVLAGYSSPASDPIVQEVWKGIRRVKGCAPKQKDALLTDHLRKICQALPDTMRGTRDRALLLIGVSGGFRRSELVAIDIEHIRFTEDGVIILVPSSKTDQEGQGVEVGIPRGKSQTCPVRALQAWISRAGIQAGPVFLGIDKHDNLLGRRMSDRGVARAVKSACELIGLDPSVFAGHSLRSGLATNAAYNGAPTHAIAAQGRWKNFETVARYIRRGELFKNNAAEYLGL